MCRIRSMVRATDRIHRSSLLVLFACACAPAEPDDFSYYEDRIAPVVNASCARNPSGAGCHLGQADGTALGNLDVSSYDALMRRDDALHSYGPYPVGLLFMKAGEQVDIGVSTFNPDPAMRFVTVRTAVRHANGNGFDLGSSAYSQVKQWATSGYQRNGLPREVLNTSSGECVHLDREVRDRTPGFDPMFYQTHSDAFNEFLRSGVHDILRDSCAGSHCHGSPIADLYLTCGDGPEEEQWNFWVAAQHVNATDGLESTSELLRRPLGMLAGGVYHEGGDILGTTDPEEDPRYQTMLEWIQGLDEAVTAPPTDISDGLRFFADRVQPALVREGCMFLSCHSPSMFHDLRLRNGSLGHFAHVATRRNYEMSRLQLAVESPDPNASRIIAKNLFESEVLSSSQGISHRGGRLFEDEEIAGGDVLTAADCAPFDAEADPIDDVPTYCILVRWHEIEREEAIASGEIFPATEPVRSLIWVARDRANDPRDFEAHSSADLMIAVTTLDAAGAVTLAGARSLNAGCGLAAGADVRGPAVSWDGARVAFAARPNAGTPFRLYWMDSNGDNCEPIPMIADAQPERNGVRTHDIDPAWAPDGRIVFASSRGYDGDSPFGERATRTPAANQPNANLFIFDPTTGEVQPRTYLLNQEIQPAFMADGRVVMTSEKFQEDFHQLAGRRMNLDGTDYHPLFAQRGTVGYASATEIVELANRNLAIVAAPIDAVEGAGTIVIINRSIGPAQFGRTSSQQYIDSQRFPLGGPASGSGVYRSPAPLPNGRVIVSCDRGAGSPTAGGFDFDLCELNLANGALRDIGGAAGRSDIEAVAVYARPQNGVFTARPDEANGNTRIDESLGNDAEIEVLDFPLLATLLFANTRDGRPIDSRIGGFDVLAEFPPDDPGTPINRRQIGHVPLNVDGSARFRIPGGLPIVLRVTDGGGAPLVFGEGAPFTGEMRQREQMQFIPGERSRQSFPRQLFNSMCGGCHGSITNRELDISPDVDVLTRASIRESANLDAVTLRP
jgi:hypothetical protein